MNITQPHILIVDDDDQIRTLLKEFLQQKNWLISTAEDTKSADAILSTLSPDAIILDVMMPGETGVEFLSRFRKTNNTPVLMLTAASELNDKVEGLLAGADDYLSKPFEPEELLLRIKAILRRTRPEITAPSEIKIGDMHFDCNRGILTKDDSVLKLTEGENTLLSILATNPGEVFSREELTKKSKIEGGDRAVDVQITRLRKKMEVDPKMPYFVQTVRGKGYILRV